MTPIEVLIRSIDTYLTLPPSIQDPELLAIYMEYRSNLLRIRELDENLRKAHMRLLLSDMPTANGRLA